MVTPVDTLPPNPWHFPRPELAEGYLYMFGLGLVSARGLFARRRMGKTQFLQRDLLPAAAAAGYLTAYANFWDDRETPQGSLVGALAKALAPKGLRSVLARLSAPVKKVKASAKIPGGFEGALEAELASLEIDHVASMHELLAQFDREKKSLLLVLDEAQVLARDEHSTFAHALRSALDIRKDKIKVIFAGSSETTLREMFARESEPFYNWAALESFPLLGEDYVKFSVNLINKMARNRLTVAQGMQAFEELHRTPEFFRRFLERYMLFQTLGAEDALTNTKASVFSDEQFLRKWDGLSQADQSLLAMLAQGERDLHSARGIEKLSSMLDKPATKNTVAQGLRRLQTQNIVARLTVGEYRIEDEAFAEWLRKRNAKAAPSKSPARNNRGA